MLRIQNLFFIVGLLMLVVGCHFNNAETPTPTLSEEKMLDLLVDIHVAEGSTYGMGTRTRDTTLVRYYQQIFQLHGLTKEEFDQNYEAWFSNPKRADDLYRKLMERLNEAETKNQKAEGLTPINTAPKRGDMNN